MAVIRNAAKNKGVRFDESDIPHGEVVSPNKYIAVFRGSACKLLDRIFESGEGSRAGMDARTNLDDLRQDPANCVGDVKLRNIHNVQMTPNEKS